MKISKLVIMMVLLVIAVSAGSVYLSRTDAAHADVAGDDLGQVATSQIVAEADSGYASSVAELVSVTTELSNPFPTRPGRSLIVVASTDRLHFVAATKLPDGKMLVRSDEHREAITCASYTADCIATLTADASLINATPAWEAY